MPIYEFKCKDCLVVTQGSFPINNNVKKVKCRKCGKTAEKIISTSNFKVNGFSEKNGYSKGEK